MAGLQGGDVIVGMAGTNIENIYDFVRVLNGLKVKQPVDIIVKRKGADVKLSIVPAPRE